MTGGGTWSRGHGEGDSEGYPTAPDGHHDRMRPTAADPSYDPAHLLPLLSRATERLLADVARLTTDADARTPSGLPGWTRGHVLTHLARNAEDHARMAAAAARGELAEQYPGGEAQRQDEIERGAVRPVGELLDDVAGSAALLWATWAEMPDDAWDRPIAMLDGTEPARTGPRSRLAECELHHVDLRLGYGPSDWPAAFVDVLLPRVAGDMAARAARLEVPVARWVVRRRDGGEAGDDRDGREWVIGSGPGGGEVVGDGASLLAWLSGRGWSLRPGALTVDGDAAAAFGLPERVPYG